MEKSTLSEFLETRVCFTPRRKTLWKKFAVLVTICGVGALLYFCIAEVETCIEGMKFVKARCSVNESGIQGEILCDCGVYVPSACYPCLKVLVVVGIDGEKEKFSPPVLLYESVFTLDQICSYKPPSCCHDNVKNTQSVMQIQKEMLAMGPAFECHYNPRNTSQVILHRHNYEWIVASCFLWPSLAIVFGIASIRFIENMEERDAYVKQLIMMVEAKRKISGKYHRKISSAEPRTPTAV
ncbi:calcium-activated potassium channel subunit beta-4 [Nematostella vectensis]|uniref:calcium-activated potassium channel subunit beta-4 n=1 Tax=Nematostella vectensis TaxID=45351 RepID=UPI0020770215|nr:calcium-activated potassium channel subunit beta-4 [Nematostella vectensis]